MSVSHSKVAEAFAVGKEATGSRMFTDGKVIYSYGEHFPIAMRLSSNDYLFNEDRCSVSTTQHQGHVRCAISGNIYECTTEEIKDAVRNPGKPIILAKDRDYDNFDDIMDALGALCHKKGMKVFPRQKWKDMIEDNVSISVMRGAMRSDDITIRAFPASKLKDVHDGRMKDAISLVVKLLDDPEEKVAKKAYVSLMANLHRMNGRVLTRVDRMLKSGTNLTCFTSPHAVYVGAINTRYKSKCDENPSSVLLYRDDEEILWYGTVGRNRYGGRSYLLKLDPENILHKRVLLGVKSDGAIVTTTLNREVYKEVIALFDAEES